MASAAPSLERQSVLKDALVELKSARARLRKMEQARTEPIAIVGIGCRFPGGGDSPDQLWRLLREGRDAVREIPAGRWDVERYYDADASRPGKMYVRHGAFLESVDGFDAPFFRISPREAASMDPQQRLLLEVTWEALEHAGIAPDTLPGSHTGVFVGMMLHDYASLGIKSANPALIDTHYTTGNGMCFAAGRLSYFLGLHGPSLAVDTACSSSLVAVHLACQSLRQGECRMALAGGANLILAPEPSIAFCKSGMLSPDGRCKTFDASADGMGRGEGCGVVVLKRLSDAELDGDAIVAVILGSAVNQDGPSGGLTVPNGQAQEAVIRKALASANVAPDQVSYVETHGTGTPLGDPIEVRAIGGALCEGRSATNPLTIGSVKTNFGHLEGAAGIAGLIKVALSLQHGEIPPHLHFKEPSPHIPWAALPVNVATAPTPWSSRGQRRIAGLSSFGLSGTNAHALLAEAPVPRGQEPGLERPVHLLPLSAKSPNALRLQAERLAAHLTDHPELNLADVAHAAGAGRTHFHERLCVLGSTTAEALAELRAYATGEPLRATLSGRAGKGLKIAFLFTGQGSQHAGMGRELYETQPTFRRILDECDALLRPRLDTPLLEVLYPSRDGASPIDETAYAQPALFALEYALARLWMSWGLRPQAVLGHSIGEYVAACIAGVFSLDDGLALVAERGRLMQALPHNGAMLAVHADVSALADVLASHRDISIAAVNGPQNVVISGARVALEAARASLEERGVGTQPLTVSHAFHSPLMEPVLAPFAGVVAGVRSTRPEIDLVSNLTGEICGDEILEPSYWCRHLREPVQFAKSVELLCAQGYGTFVEIGPHPVLTQAGRLCRPEHEALWLSSLRRNGRDWTVILQSLAQAYVQGADVDWAAFDHDHARRRVSLPTYPFERQPYWIDVPTAEAPAPSPGVAEVVVRPMAARHPRPQLASSYVAPTTPTEARIAELWEDVLGLEPIGLHDDFFELGGDSLLANVLVTRLRGALAIDLPLSSLLVDSPTVAGIAVAVERFHTNPQTRPAPTTSEPESEPSSAALPVIVPRPAERHLPFPLTDIQQAYWVGRSMTYDLGDVSIHAYTEFDATDLDLPRLERAWGRVVARHDMLRAIVLPDGRQQVLASVPDYAFRTLDLRSWEPEAATRELDAIREEMSHQVLPVDRFPTFDVRATHLDDHRIRIHVSLDLLNCDGGSLMIINDEWLCFYQDPALELPALELAYRDYVLAGEALQGSELFRRSWDYWRERVPLLPPAPELPAAPASSTRSETVFSHRTARLGPEAWLRLKTRATRHGLTSSAALLAAYAEILAAWSKKAELTVNVTLFNRLPVHPQVNEIVGDFTSMILLAVANDPSEPFQARARALQQQLWSDLEHRYVSGVQVLRELARVQGRTAGALMPVVFTSLLNLGAQGFRPPLASLRGLGEVVYSVTQTPQVLLDHQVLEEDGALVLNWDAVDGAFPPGLLDDMFAAYQALLGRLATEESAWQDLRRSHVPAAQLDLMESVNATDAPIPDLTLRDLFLARAQEAPERLAVVATTRCLTYEGLRRRSNRLGRRLQDLGARANGLVAIVMEKGWEQVVAALGIHAAGAAYVPIDPALPFERRRVLLADAEARLVVTQPWLAEALEWPEGTERVLVEDEEPSPADDRDPEPACGPHDLSHVIYTSGSSGRPKGVMIEHRSVVNRILDVNRRQAVGPDDRVLALTALNHDLSVYDVFGLLAAGGSLVVPEADRTRDPDHWADLMVRHGITIWNSVPAYLEMLVEHLEHADEALRPRTLRWAILSGDWIPVPLPDRLRALLPGVQVIASGGPTETTIWDVWNPVGEVDPRSSSIPYGKPMAGARYYVLGESLEPRPVWAAGELCIAGAGLARGYWHDEERTKEQFVAHPVTRERIYRSGDLGRLLPDGTIEFLGRADFQVKVGGYRIELGEIESVLQRHPAVRAAAVAALGETRGHKRLVAYVVPTEDRATSPTAAQLLADYQQYESEGITLLDPLARVEFKKRQPGLRPDGEHPTVSLDRPVPDEALRLAYLDRRSHRDYAREPLPLSRLGQLLACLSSLDVDGLPKYRYGSAGGLYPVQTYVHVKDGRVEGLTGGSYYYNPREHRLTLLSPGVEIPADLHAPNNRDIFERSAFSVFLIGQLSAIQPMYGKWARDFCLLEAGYMSQLLMTVAPGSGIGLCPIGDMKFEPLRGLFALEESHVLVHSLLGGGLPAEVADWAAEQRAFASASNRRSPQVHEDLSDELRRFLERNLPEQMVPSAVVLLSALPLTPNGKIDRRALPAPEQAPAAAAPTFVAPATELEQTLAAIVGDVLELEQVGVHHNFFELGGNSVHMVQILTRLREALGREIAITELFRRPTIHALAAHLGGPAEEAASLERADERAETRRASMGRRQVRRPRADAGGEPIS